MLIQGDEKLKTARRKYLSFDTLSKIARKTRFCRTHAYMIDEMAIYLKVLDLQGLFRILAEQYGYRVEKISLKEKWVRFVRIAAQ